MSYVCEYCGAVFSRTYNLTQHQARAKYCLALRKKEHQKTICDYCGKEVSRRDNLRRHMDICRKAIEESKTAKLEGDMQELKQMMSTLINKTEVVTTGSTPGNRNIVTNLQPILEEDIQAKAIEYLTIKDLKRGAAGLAAFVLDYQPGQKLVCLDKSRKKFQYRDANGQIINDTGGIKLSQTFFKAINQHNQQLIKREYNEIHAKVKDILSRGAAHDENAAELMMEAMRIQTLAEKCNEIAEGGDNELRVDFVNKLVKHL